MKSILKLQTAIESATHGYLNLEVSATLTLNITYVTSCDAK